LSDEEIESISSSDKYDLIMNQATNMIWLWNTFTKIQGGGESPPLLQMSQI
jgi:hypothetical protein